MSERISLFVLATLIAGASLAQAGSDNCRSVQFKSLDEVVELFSKSGIEKIGLIKSAYSPSTLTIISTTQNGEIKQKTFSSKSATDESNSSLWKRVPEFDYDDLPASLNASCGYGHVNYKLAYAIGDSALCYMLNPKSSVVGRKGQLESCLFISEDIGHTLDQVKRQFPEKFR